MLSNSEKNPLISVIIPVYGTEKFLRRCIHSISTQTYINLEIIIVDDGSKDQSPQICDEYAQKDNRITVIHKPNGGVSSARNAGLDVCTGDLISFIDGDDWIHEKTYEVIVREFLKKELSAVYFEANIVNLDDEVTGSRFHYYDKATLLPPGDMMQYLLTDTIGSQPCIAVYKRECWKDLRFPQNRIFEDLAILYRAFENVKEPLLFLNQKFYYYRMNPNGISLGSGNIKKNHHIFLAFRDHYLYAINHGLNPETCDMCFKKSVLFAIGTINTALKFPSDPYDAYQSDVQKFLKEHTLDIWHSRIINLKTKVFVQIYLASSRMYGHLYYIFKRK